MNNFFTRTLSGIVFVAVIALCVYYSVYSFLILMGVVATGCLYEYYKLVKTGSGRLAEAMGYLAALVIFLSASSVCVNSYNPYLTALIPVSVFAVILSGLFTKSSSPFAGVSLVITGLIYVVASLSLFVMFSCLSGTYQWQLVFAFFILQWSSDTGQYCFGMLFGKHRLFERISPKKSWEGFIGGLLFTIGISFIVSVYFDQFQNWQWAGISAIIVVFGTLGDLVESLLKRQAGVKDSGSIMPGHGGFLDRFDALLVSAPFVYAFVKLTAQF